MHSNLTRIAALALATLLLQACGGSSDGNVNANTASNVSSNSSSEASSSISSASSSQTSAQSSSPASSSASSSSSSSTTSTSAAAQLAIKLGLPTRLLVGIGGYNETSDIQSQGITPDIYDRYLSNYGSNSWIDWNTPSGAYVNVVAQQAESVGAIPMYTLYQMAANGDGNLSGLSSTTFMSTYWADVKLMFQKIAAYGKPTLVNFEPDFWGYVELGNNDPTKTFAYVNINSDCSSLSNHVAGIAACLIKMARQYAPNAYIGFPPSDWGASTTTQVIAFMNALGASQADFIIMQTSDRDAGCYETTPQPSYCTLSSSGWYWDESNTTHPNFADHLTVAAAYHTGIGSLPLLWWQTPMGVPSTSKGGTDYHYRDNRAHYFLTHPAELVAAGGIGVVFGGGEIHQTTITTDSGQFQSLLSDYLAAPAVLP